MDIALTNTKPYCNGQKSLRKDDGEWIDDTYETFDFMLTKTQRGWIDYQKRIPISQSQSYL